MQPSVIVRLDALPLGPNAKVNRTALPLPVSETRAAAAPSGDAVRPAAGVPLVAGAAPAKGALPAASAAPAADDAPDAPRRIAARVAGILGREQVEPQANWLDLGASSVDMVRIANVVELETGFRPRIDHLYAEPTLEALITYLCDQNLIAKPVALNPAALILICETDTLELPVFARVTLCVPLVPVVMLPKLSDAGEAVSWATGDTPVPVKGTTNGELSVLFTSVRLPERLLAEAGVKRTVKAEEPPGGTESGNANPE